MTEKTNISQVLEQYNMLDSATQCIVSAALQAISALFQTEQDSCKNNQLSEVQT